MKKRQLFLGIAITFVMMVLGCSPAKSFSLQYPKSITELNKKTLSLSVTPQRLPTSNSSEQNIPEFKTAATYSNLPASFCIRSTQEIFCLFEILFEKEKFEKYEPRIPVTLNSLFRHLFRVIISPNAP